MANQYGGDFLQYIQIEFHCSAEELLKQFSAKGLSILEVVDEIGCSESVIKKYAKLYEIDFIRKAAPGYKLKKATRI